jgi:hypothetical protein
MGSKVSPPSFMNIDVLLHYFLGTTAEQKKNM